ncbi:GNAT family N-acetyltransferase [Micrococcoides hystricis]|uniref:GNAT family N-acetyltransferase n=1 Tax=Micrococcoides hystricis TaxID=1572761 RepID=A0ABV6P9B6_9MICC
MKNTSPPGARPLGFGLNGFTVSRALATDVPAIVNLLADDYLGVAREDGDLTVYERAFELLDPDPRHFLAVVKDSVGTVVGTMHLMLLPHLSRSGTTRLQIEAVRVGKPVRGMGVGAAMIEWAHAWGKENGAGMAQLTSDKTRADALRFYSRLGYTASHEGMKKQL